MAWNPCPPSRGIRAHDHVEYATLALNSAEYRFRFPVIRPVLQRGRTHLSRLSDFPAPPQPSPAAEPEVSADPFCGAGRPATPR